MYKVGDGDSFGGGECINLRSGFRVLSADVGPPSVFHFSVYCGNTGLCPIQSTHMCTHLSTRVSPAFHWGTASVPVDWGAIIAMK